VRLKHILTGVALLGLVYALVEIAAFLRTGAWLPGYPHLVVLEYFVGLLRKKTEWTSTHTFTAVGLAVVTLLLTKKVKSPTQEAAKHLGKGEQMSLAAVTKRSDAGRLTESDTKGLMLVRTMERKPKPRYADWRQTGLVVMGPGASKTTGFAIPMSLDAPGVVFATSNKRDLADALANSRPGDVLIFDPQQIVSKKKPPFRIDFNQYVTDEVRAHKLAKIWVDAASPLGAKKDAYFDSAGPNLLAGMLLACSVAKLPISQVFLWLMDFEDRKPVRILKEAGYLLPAAAMEAVYFAPEEQRGGVFGTAAEMVSFLNNSRVRSWLESEGKLDKRPVLSPEDFVRSGNGTLIALSKEGIGSTGPLTASLTVWVLDAAEDLADQSPHGRLRIPLVCMLDEVANVCRIHNLMDLMSHYGSRGIPLWPILQNFAQGVRVWGEDGMRQMWGAANIRIIGAGQADEKFLRELSGLIGHHLVTEYSANNSSGKSGGGYSRTVSEKKELVLDVDDLAALRPGECIVHASGDRAYLATTYPWYEREGMKDLVSASIAANEPR
jgi:type IV secretory pathway TraG/TraD family ATPase VirD4